METFLHDRWSPYLVGACIGVLSWFTFLISHKAIGCSTAYARTSGMLARIFFRKKVDENTYYQEFAPVVDWEWMFVCGIVIGAFVSSSTTGDFHWQAVPATWVATFGSNIIVRFAAALAGGIILGFGARWANGCTSGHGISGTMQLAVSSWMSVLCFFISGIVTAHMLYYLIAP
jgi:uncharacterized membrane protein YedE/YeeE